MKNNFVCIECGSYHPQWVGLCNFCKSWNCVERSSEVETFSNASAPMPLISVERDYFSKHSLSSPQLDKIFEGGLVKGGVYLLYGDPGCGKTSLLNYIIKKASLKTLYISGEETISQVACRMRQHKLESSNILLQNEVGIEDISFNVKKQRPELLVIDSIQTLTSNEGGGKISLINECSAELIKISKNLNVTTFIIAHVTKVGELSGPKHLEHMVDVVLRLTSLKEGAIKLLTPRKNRFGSLNFRAQLLLESDGMKEYLNDSTEFLTTDHKYPGRTYGLELEGDQRFFYRSDCLLRESKKNGLKIVNSGVEMRRIELILATLEKSMGVSFNYYSLFLRLKSPLKTLSREGSLALAASIWSGYVNKSPKENYIFLGDIDLYGNIKSSIKKSHLNIKKEKGFTLVSSKELASHFDCAIGLSHINELRQFYL